MPTTITYEGTSVTYNTQNHVTELTYGQNEDAATVQYKSGYVTLEHEKGLCVNRGMLLLGNTPTDQNHAIYNNGDGVDGGDSWDGLIINCHKGMKVRTENAGEATRLEVLEITPTAISSPLTANFRGQFKVGNTTAEASAALAGTLKYFETDTGSELHICMKNGAGAYVWRKLAEE